MYIRMGFSMLVSLFTSRVILQVLGVTDMGIQATVGGVVGFMGFINTALSGGTSRFLTVALGRGDKEEIAKTFSTTFWVHASLAIIFVVGLETIGLWFLYNKLIIPPERMDAAAWCFHLGVLSIIFGMTQVPYGACLVAHEKFNMFAYLGMLDVCLKLVIVYILTVFDFDKLKLYSTLLFLVHLGMMLFYRWYCTQNFVECKLRLIFDKAIFKPILEFSGWQLFANSAIAFSNQGILILLNMFFSPAIVASRTISLQVNNVARQFMDSFKSASNPQIIKRYAAGDHVGSKKMLLETTQYCFFLMLLTCLPTFLLSYQLLYVWLGQVPEYTDIFVRLIVIQSLVQTFNSGFYTAIYANGRMRENALSAPLILFSAFPFIYVLFKMGASPVALSYAYIISYAVQAFIQKPLILVKYIDYKWSDFNPLYWNCFKVTVAACIIPVIFRYGIINNLTTNHYIIFFSVGTISVLSTVAAIWYIGLDEATRTKLLTFIKKKLKRI
jgi:Na+-driven multidrug efflux pump